MATIGYSSRSNISMHHIVTPTVSNKETKPNVCAYILIPYILNNYSIKLDENPRDYV